MASRILFGHLLVTAHCQLITVFNTHKPAVSAVFLLTRDLPVKQRCATVRLRQQFPPLLRRLARLLPLQ
jgi:hypothetical protein